MARETCGRRAGWVPESGRTDLGIPEEAGVLARKVLSAWKVLPAPKACVRGRTCACEIAGVIGSDVPWLECPACNTLTWVITAME